MIEYKNWKFWIIFHEGQHNRLAVKMQFSTAVNDLLKYYTCITHVPGHIDIRISNHGLSRQRKPEAAR